MATSEARRIANARNAQHSTGPKSDEGKKRSSMNALKHGLTAVEAVLPNEDPDAYQATLDQWFAFDRPRTPPTPPSSSAASSLSTSSTAAPGSETSAPPNWSATPSPGMTSRRSPRPRRSAAA